MLNSKKTFAAILLGACAANVLPARAESVQVNDLKRTPPMSIQKVAGVQPGAKTPPAAKCENSPDGKNLTNSASNSSTNNTTAKPPAGNKPAPADNERPAETREEVVSEGACDGSSVQQVELCDVTGTVCEDCGEIVLAGGVLPEFAEAGALAGGGFSLSPLFSLAAIPLALLPTLRRSGDNQLPDPMPPGLIISADEPPSDITPVLPVPPTTPVPEPLSLLLFGSGLSAIAASVRRRQKSRLAESSADAAVVEG